jgi:hypothetical protein
MAHERIIHARLQKHHVKNTTGVAAAEMSDFMGFAASQSATGDVLATQHDGKFLW